MFRVEAGRSRSNADRVTDRQTDVHTYMHVVKEERSRLYSVRGAPIVPKNVSCRPIPGSRDSTCSRLDRNYEREAIFLHRDLTDGPDRSTVRYH